MVDVETIASIFIKVFKLVMVFFFYLKFVNSSGCVLLLGTICAIAKKRLEQKGLNLTKNRSHNAILPRNNALSDKTPF